jgi:hypothetical protein
VTTSTNKIKPIQTRARTAGEHALLWTLIITYSVAHSLVISLALSPLVGVYNWIVYGEWQSITLHAFLSAIGMPIPSTKLVGIQRIFNFFLTHDIDFTIIPIIILLGIATAFLAAINNEIDVERTKFNSVSNSNLKT